MTRDEFMDVVYDELYSDGDNNRANRIIDAADDYVDEYAPHWIPVKERLPEVGQRVLAQQRDGSSRACRCIDGGHLAWFFVDTVAWMPLPEPYKEGAQ